MHEKISFDEHLHRIFGDDYDAFISHAPVGEFVRVNTQRATPERVMSLLKSQGFDVEQVAGLDDAIRLRTKPFEPTRCLHHFAGWFVKQSLSSQLPVRFLDARPGQTIIDLCAAPGSKTTQIATAMHNEGCLFANDLAGKRMTPLAARLDAGIVSPAVLFNVAAERLPHYLDPVFDRVLADVPCSGLGLFDAIDENRHRYEAAKNPSSQYQLQYRILLSGARLLRVGGRLVYSTCSLNPDENEGVVSQFLARYPFRLVEIPDIAGIHFRPGLTSWQGCEYGEEMTRARRVTPWENDTQGFFMAVLEKTDELPERLSYPPRATEPVRTLAPDDEAVAPILANIERYYGIDPSAFGALRFLLSARAIYAIDGHWEEIPGGYQRAGICLAKRRGGIWRLSHSMIQRFSDEITRNTLTLDDDQMAQICATGDIDVAIADIESPYPVLRYEPLGALASLYDMGGGRVHWKRACDYQFARV